mmetsp:Transcript_47069/g.134755  ORF Transcript_47069/g.134755 Transcript_47069/m.134755 type:complete len:245 (-) Transcript_47069:40-774(-)
MELMPIMQLAGPLATKIAEVLPESFKLLHVRVVARALGDVIGTVTNLVREREALVLVLTSLGCSTAHALRAMSFGNDQCHVSRSVGAVDGRVGQSYSRHGSALQWCGCFCSCVLMGVGVYVALRLDSRRSDHARLVVDAEEIAKRAHAVTRRVGELPNLTSWVFVFNDTRSSQQIIAHHVHGAAGGAVSPTDHCTLEPHGYGVLQSLARTSYALGGGVSLRLAQCQKWLDFRHADSVHVSQLLC